MEIQKKNKTGLIPYFKKRKVAIFFYLFLMVLINVSGVALTFMVAQFLAEITSAAYSMAITFLIALTGVTLGQVIFRYIINRIFIYEITQISFEIKKDLMSRLFLLSSSTFSNNATGLFLTRINSDPERALFSLDMIIESFVELFTVIITLVYIAVLSVWVALALAVTITVLLTLEYFKNKAFTKNTKKYLEATEKATSITTEIVRSERDIKSLNLEPHLESVVDKRFGKYRDTMSRRQMTQRNFATVRDFLLGLFSFGIMFLCIFLLENTFLSVASFLFIFTNRSSVREISRTFGSIAETIIQYKISSKRMFEIYDEEKFPLEVFGTENIKDFKGEIEFKDVIFSYKETENNSEIPVFKGINFKIPANKTVAFVGKSGSGKTTLLNMICKLYAADGGEILIDGKPIKSLDKPSLRDNMSLVNQFPYIFDTSIRHNLLMANDKVSDEELEAACKKACLHDFILSLSQGYKTRVGEGGVKLSGGQRQRLAIARALLRKSKVILFDESTSSLDNSTQEEIKKAIENLGGEKTVIMVAHRLSTIKNSDIIYYIDEGIVKAQGSFDELIKKSKEFKEFFELEHDKL